MISTTQQAQVSACKLLSLWNAVACAHLLVWVAPVFPKAMLYCVNMLSHYVTHVFCLTHDIAVTSGVAEVMSLVTGLDSDTEAGSQEVTGPTDPIRVVVTHTLQPDSSSITFSIELLSRLTADIKGLVLRYYVTKGAVCLAERWDSS